MMKGGARLRLDLDEGWCEILHYITIHQKRIDLDEGWCETLHYITIHQKRIDLDMELTMMKGGARLISMALYHVFFRAILSKFG